MKDELMGYKEALRLTLESISPLEAETVLLAMSTDRVTADDLYALVDSPSADVSMKDGYAICASDIEEAAADNPVRLKVSGVAAAGGQRAGVVVPGTAIRILTGARVPAGADAVVAEEFTRKEGKLLTVLKHARPGRNILAKGSDVALGELMIPSGYRLTPARVGVLAAAGHSHISVVRQLRVGIIATGDEVVAPGEACPRVNYMQAIL